jgi:hypothetical protein
MTYLVLTLEHREKAIIQFELLVVRIQSILLYSIRWWIIYYMKERHLNEWKPSLSKWFYDQDVNMDFDIEAFTAHSQGLNSNILHASM